jgi:OHCU decarboxylase
VGQSSKPPHTSLNELSLDAAREALTQCCGSQRWVEAMIARRPFESTLLLLDAARDTWQSLDRQDYVEAFNHHPHIGESLSELAKRSPRAAKMVAREQAKLTRADPEALHALREANQRYIERFGYTFVAASTGKSAQELLESLHERLGHDPSRELDIAAEEQTKLTTLRLAQLA